MATSRELAEQAFSLLQDALKDTEAKAAELDAELKKQRAPKNQVEQQIQVLEHRLETLKAESDNWRREAAQLESIVENERAKSTQLKKKLEIAESGPDKVDKKEVNYWRSRAEQFDADTEQYKQRIVELTKELKGIRAQRDTADDKVDEQIRERDAQLAAQSARIAGLEADAMEQARRIEELAQARSQAETERLSIQDKLAALETELKQESECTINLSEIANERREQITELSEQLDEARERYEEAKWNLERASRFERLVNKRRKLIDSLIEGLRAKHRSNTALKAGLDGLRKFKAKAEEQQQKLLVRIEDLSSQLKEAREQLVARRKSDKAEGKLRKATETISSLEDRLGSKEQVIERLESELTAARTERQTADRQAEELTSLRSTVAEWKETIASLEAELVQLREQADANRDGDSNAAPLGDADLEQQQVIDDLKLELDALKAELQQRAAGAQAPDAEAAAEIRKRDAQITDLKRRLKDQDREIAKLKEVAAGWQKKYEFLSADSPTAYQSTAVEK